MEKGQIIILVVIGILIGMMVFYNIMLSKLNRKVDVLEVALVSMLDVVSDTFRSYRDHLDELKGEAEKLAQKDQSNSSN